MNYLIIRGNCNEETGIIWIRRAIRKAVWLLGGLIPCCNSFTRFSMHLFVACRLSSRDVCTLSCIRGWVNIVQETCKISRCGSRTRPWYSIETTVEVGKRNRTPANFDAAQLYAYITNRVFVYRDTSKRTMIKCKISMNRNWKHAGSRSIFLEWHYSWSWMIKGSCVWLIFPLKSGICRISFDI